jgi:GntR family transcriptional regulator, transcriptional repressor for pyruvate dehydrogenase complex
MVGRGRGAREDAVPAQTATSTVAEALTQIVLRDMAPGSSMPSEADLALRFGVSRLTVREAVKMLAGRGLLDVGRGRRAIVREPNGVAMSDFLSVHVQNDPKGLFDVLELRSSLETLSASLAARRLNRAGLAALEAAMNGMQETGKETRGGPDPDASEVRFHDHDLGFHGAVALASGNRLISYLFEAMAAPLRRGFYLSRRGHYLRGGTVEETIAAHQQILVAIREGNPKAAELAMRNHLEDTERDIRAALDSASGQHRTRGLAPEEI